MCEKAIATATLIGPLDLNFVVEQHPNAAEAKAHQGLCLFMLGKRVRGVELIKVPCLERDVQVCDVDS